jgi:hypothetical protein
MVAWVMYVRNAGNARGVPTPVPTSGLGSSGALLAVVVDPLEEAIELFTERREAELVVENWNRDEPDRAGELHVEPIELETSPN